MKLLASIALLVLLQPANAEDFRTLNFGESCIDVDRKELALGSVKLSEAKPIFQGRFDYHGIGLEGKALIAYNCGENNSLQSGFIYYRFHEF